MRTTTRSAGATLTAAGLLALGALLAPAPATTAAPAAPAAPAASTARSTDGTDDGTTRVVLRFDGPEDCTRCRVQLVSGLATDDPDEPRLWASLGKRVRDGKVALPVAHTSTAGLSITLDAPWEGHTGYATNVVVRYAGLAAGDEVTAEVAQEKHRASGCLEGTSRDKLVLGVHAEQVQVQGVQDEVTGTLAYLDTTMPWLVPMERVVDGVLGSQDVRVCH